MSNQTLPLVTIGMPTYNRANRYLREALESALAQTYPNLEIVVSDNGSTDNTESVVRSYADPRISYYRQQPPVIPNDNFNFCLQQAKGVYFLMLHDDDMIDPDFIDTCMRAANYDEHLGIIRTGTRVINVDGTVIDEGPNRVAGLSITDFILGWFSGLTSLYVCSTLYNVTGLRSMGGFHSRHNLFQDVAATTKLAAAMGRVDIEKPMASTRQHGGKWTHVARVREWCEDSLDLLALLCDLVPERAMEIRGRGERFFANINYSYACNIRSPADRLRAYFIVYRFFDKRYLPPWRMVFASTSLYRALRHVKRRVLGLPAWVE
jgi:glycosyltransferase involved in cell wall biosynthesis